MKLVVTAALAFVGYFLVLFLLSTIAVSIWRVWLGYGGSPDRTFPVIVVASLFAAAGGSHGVWLRERGRKLKPTSISAISDAGNDADLEQVVIDSEWCDVCNRNVSPDDDDRCPECHWPL